jgi:ParB-like chromosome segregation protein Spo0J
VTKRRRSAKVIARTVAVKEWRAHALQLRVKGLTIRQIAKALGKSKSAVHKGLDAEINAIPAEGVAELREIVGARLDAVVRGSLARARKGDANAAFVVIAASTAQAKLFGLNAPAKVQLDAELELQPNVHHELLTRLARLAGDAGDADAETAATTTAAAVLPIVGVERH